MTETNPNNVEAGKAENPFIWIKVNINYFMTNQGIVKLVQLLFGIVCMACASPAIFSGTHWFLFVVIISFIATLIWVFVYLLSIREALTLPINWILTEIINTGIITIIYLVGAIVQLTTWSNEIYYYRKGANIAAGIFALFNTLAYAAGTYLLYAEWKASAVQ